MWSSPIALGISKNWGDALAQGASGGFPHEHLSFQDTEVPCAL